MERRWKKENHNQNKIIVDTQKKKILTDGRILRENTEYVMFSMP